MKPNPSSLKFLALFVVVIGAALAVGCLRPKESGNTNSGAAAADPSMHSTGTSSEVTLKLTEESGSFTSGAESILKFKLSNPGGVLTEPQFEATHEKLLHLVVVDANLDDFHHVHPTLVEGGTWTQSLAFPSGGRYLVFADGKVSGGSSFVAKSELHVTGSPKSKALSFDPNPES